MKKILAVILLAFMVCTLACTNSDKTTWEDYTDWREANNAWIAEMQNRKDDQGKLYYKVVVPEWNTGSYILIHYFNDRAETEGNLTPLSNSTVDVRYQLHLYDDTPIDSSNNVTTTGVLGIYRAQISSLIPGWGVAMSEMRCGDTVEVLIPYQLGYGANSSGDLKPYSNLRFNIRLEDIYRYEATPY